MAPANAGCNSQVAGRMAGQGSRLSDVSLLLPSHRGSPLGNQGPGWTQALLWLKGDKKRPEYYQ